MSLHMNSRVVVIADPLRGYGIIRDFERDGRPLVQFEADYDNDESSGAEWDPPDLLVPFDPHELELAWVWERNATGSITDADLDQLRHAA